MTCLICQRIEQINEGNNLNFVKELKTGYVVLGDYQYCRGYTLFLSKEHKTELHQLTMQNRLKHLQELALVAEAVYQAFRPKKLNYELMGNSHPHIHWHLFPRHEDHAKPIWTVKRSVRQKVLSPAEMKVLKKRLAMYLSKLVD
jgi:diadenosine tetraphosphate (Ap4A) HIT family hydrolase